MLFFHLLINYVILTLKNVEYQFNTKYCDMWCVKNSIQRF